jgi:acetyl esterase/lipase
VHPFFSTLALSLGVAEPVPETPEEWPPAAEPLWPGGAPGAQGVEPADIPTLAVFEAPVERASRAAIIVCPGGGYGHHAEHEGAPIARWLNSLGIAAAVLKYRLGPRYHHPAMLQDAQHAIRTLRARAPDWELDPQRIGILGFSAGGHLASTAATHFDPGNPIARDPIERVSSRPDLAILLYPVISLEPPVGHAGSQRNLLGEEPDGELVQFLSNERHVTPSTPPTFLFHTADDAGVPAENSLLFALALARAGVPYELHIYAKGRHGVGLAREDPVLSTWTARCADWLQGLGFTR